MTTTTGPATASDHRARLAATAARLLARLESYVPGADRKGDRGALAALRRAAGKRPGEVIEAARTVYAVAPVDLREDEVEALFTVATLFALHPHHRKRPEGGHESRAERGLGASLRAIRSREESADEDDGVARRFIAALESGTSGLPVHLRQLVKLLDSRAESTPIDYHQLFFDLLDWEAEDRRVQRAWAAGFWGVRPGEEAADAPAPETTGDASDNDNSEE